jgi:plasmid stabilization system protein ParE
LVSLSTARVSADQEEIADYIGRENPVRAASFVAELTAKCRAVAASPKLYLISRVAEGSVLAIVSQANGTKPAAWAF